MTEPFEVFPPPDFVPTGSAIEGIEIYKPAPPPRGVAAKPGDKRCPGGYFTSPTR
jgi:hypothetical protein